MGRIGRLALATAALLGMAMMFPAPSQAGGTFLSFSIGGHSHGGGYYRHRGYYRHYVPRYVYRPYYRYRPAPVVVVAPPVQERVVVREVVVAPPVAPAPVVRRGIDTSYCREYSRLATIGGKPQEIVGTACYQADGSWAIVDGN